MSSLRVVVATVRLVHPAPAFAVVVLSAALGAVLLAEAHRPLTDPRLALVVLSILGSQIATGALNDWADRHRDALVQPRKPIAAGQMTPSAALAVAATGLALQLGASVPLGPLPLLLGLVAVGSAAAYNLWLSRTPLSIVPYLVSFGVLPLWIAAGLDLPVDRVAGASLLAAPFAASAHLANTVRDFEADAAVGSRALAQVIGKRRAFTLAWTLAMAVGAGVGVAFMLAGDLDPLSAALGVAGLTAVAQGAAGPDRLWVGILVAAVTWTAAWGFATG